MQTRLLALKSAVPPFPINQDAAAQRAGQLFQKVRDIERFMPVFVNTGIERRYSCVPIDWYNESHGWTDRTALFIENAVNLLEDVARKLLAEAHLKVEDIDTIVVASTTRASRRRVSMPWWSSACRCAATSSGCRFSAWAARAGWLEFRAPPRWRKRVRAAA
jgi:3-oxoacyl-[acyl-carrier-protein] synthase III